MTKNEDAMPKDQQVAQPEGESLSDRVISEVRQRIIEHELRAGQKLTEGEIATLLGVSKSPVREALALLRRQGWVTVLPRSGYQVAPLTLHDAQNLTTLRLAVEPEAAALAAQRGARWPDQLAALDAYSSGSHRAARGSSMMTEHFRFHRRIGLLSGNAELDRVLTETLLKLQRYDQVQHVGVGEWEIDDDHQPLAQAIADGDGNRARALAIEHLTRARDGLMNALIASDALMSADLTPEVTPANRRRVS